MRKGSPKATDYPAQIENTTMDEEAVIEKCGTSNGSSTQEEENDNEPGVGPDIETGDGGKDVVNVSNDESGDRDDGDGQQTFTKMIEHQPHRPRRHQRSKSDGGTANDDREGESFFYSFRMPHDCNSSVGSASHNQAMNSCMPRVGNPTQPPNDYNFVLDNYVEYADNTKIPRLRGKDVDKLRAAIHSSHPIALCMTVSIACFLTYSISNHAPYLKADLSQAIVIVLVLATFPEVAASAGAGAFAGMAGPNAIPNYAWLALLSLVISGVWLLFHRFKILVGCGGRLGTCAFISMNITVALAAMPSGAVPWSLYGDSARLWSDRLELVPSILTVAASTFLSGMGGMVRLRSKIPLNPVQAPTTIALFFMLVIESTGSPYAAQLHGGFAVGSFVAMASDQYLPSVIDFVAAGFIAGLWILLLDPFFVEFGGKKGFTSFCGFVTYVLISKIWLRRPVGKGN